MQAKDGPNCRTVAVTLAEEQDRSKKDRSPEKGYRQHDALRVLLGAQRCIRQIDRWRNKYHQHGQKPDCEDPLVSTTQHVEIRPGGQESTVHRDLAVHCIAIRYLSKSANFAVSGIDAVVNGLWSPNHHLEEYLDARLSDGKRM